MSVKDCCVFQIFIYIYSSIHPQWYSHQVVVNIAVLHKMLYFLIFPSDVDKKLVRFYISCNIYIYFFFYISQGDSTFYIQWQYWTLIFVFLKWRCQPPLAKQKNRTWSKKHELNIKPVEVLPEALPEKCNIVQACCYLRGEEMKTRLYFSTVKGKIVLIPPTPEAIK